MTATKPTFTSNLCCVLHYKAFISSFVGFYRITPKGFGVSPYAHIAHFCAFALKTMDKTLSH